MARSPDELLQLVADVLGDVAGVPPEEVQLDKTLADDLDVDSLASVEVLVELYEKTGIHVSDKEAKSLVTVGDVVDFLAKKGA